MSGLGTCGHQSKVGGVGQALVATLPGEGIELRLRDPREQLHQRDAGIVNVVIGPARGEAWQARATELDEVVEPQGKEIGRQCRHAVPVSVYWMRIPSAASRTSSVLLM